MYRLASPLVNLFGEAPTARAATGHAQSGSAVLAACAYFAAIRGSARARKNAELGAADDEITALPRNEHGAPR